MNQNYTYFFCQIGKTYFLVCHRILALSWCVPMMKKVENAALERNRTSSPEASKVLTCQCPLGHLARLKHTALGNWSPRIRICLHSL